MRVIKNYSFLILCFFCSNSYAQQAVELTHYVFPVFSKGKVYQKSGSVDEAMLNYNVLSKEVVFESAPGQSLALATPEKIDTVFIAGRRFVPVNNEFYEVLSTKGYPLFLQYSCTIKEPGNDIGYGMTSVTTASPAVKSLIQSGGAYSLKLPDGFQVQVTKDYWIFKDGKYLKANSAKQIITALPDKKDKINELMKSNHTDFAKQQDIIALLEQVK